MTNQFKSLDSFFPTGAKRRSGEVVGIEVVFTLHGVRKGSMFWKRKAWYVNASVNAWHLHRGLCREFRTDYSNFCLHGQEGAVKRLLALIVRNSYLDNYIADEQGFYYSIELGNIAPKAIQYLYQPDRWGTPVVELTLSENYVEETARLAKAVREGR